MCILILLFTHLSAGAAPTVSAINEAHAQLLARHRQEAIDILIGARKSESNPNKILELDRELAKATQIFLSNEGQRLFELAESMRHAGQAGYLATYEEALKLEPLNARVLAGDILALLATKKCVKALDVVNQFAAVNAFSPEYKLLHFKTQLCSDPSTITKEQEQEMDNARELKIFRKTTRAQQHFLHGENDSALTDARAAAKMDSRFAQAYYWAWKVLSHDDAGLDEAQRYLTLCKNISAETRRMYTWEPELCTNTEEVEEFLHKEENKEGEATNEN